MIEKKELKTYDKISQLPATIKQRSCTDVVCIVIGVAFTAIMLIIAAATYNHKTFLKSNFPSDSDGSTCGYDLPSHQYLYFANLPQINQRLCVQQCPKKGDTSLKCNPTKDIGCKIEQNNKFAARFYQSNPHETRGGFFCWPTSQQLQEQINKRSNLQQRNQIYNSIDIIVYSLYIAVAVSVLYFILVQLIPNYMNFVAVIAGMVVLVVTIVCVLTYSTTFVKLKIFIGVVLLLLLIFFALTIYKHYDSLYLHSIYLKWSAKMFSDRKLSILYIPIFILILAAFIGIVVFQFTAFWTAGKLNFDPSYQIYHQLSGVFSTIMSIFLIIQTIWGLSFIKQAFNFCISGNATHWFLLKQENQNVKKSVWYPAYIMIRKHIGSVIAGAFMTGFLSIFDAIFDFLRPNDLQEHHFYNKCFEATCVCCNQVFDFVRSDALAHINLAGNPYCNSSRYCQLLCRKSNTVEYAQTSSRIYRLSAHFLIMGIVGVIALYMKGKIQIYAQILILVQTLFIATMFISYHADSAQAIQIILLTIEQLFYLSHGQNRDDIRQLKSQGIRPQLIEQIALQREKIEKMKKEKQAKKAGKEGVF